MIPALANLQAFIKSNFSQPILPLTSSAIGDALNSLYNAVATPLKIGYAVGVGGAVTQLTSKSTGVTLNKICGTITSHNASLAGGASVTFTMTNSTIAATDVVDVATKSGSATGKYSCTITATGAGSVDITITNLGATAGEVVAINFAVTKSVAS